MQTSISSQIGSLMTEWKIAHEKRGWQTFISDGIVNKDAYENSSPKLCFFLKEAYSKDNNTAWSLTEWLANGAMTRMWGAVAEWSHGIIHTTSSEIPQKPRLNNAEKTALLQKISVVNIKKSNGNVQSDYDDLLYYAMTDQAFLKRELDILNPTVIVCGNNSSILRLLYGASLQANGKIAKDGRIPYQFMKEHGYAVVGNQIILDFYHPANQYPSIMNYYTICGLYQQALKSKEGSQNVL